MTVKWLHTWFYTSNRSMIWRPLSLLVITAMLLSLGVGLINPARAEAPALVSSSAPIEPDVYIALEQEGTAKVLVVLKEQADLSGAALLQTKAEKGQFVYDQLTTVAQRTQGSIRGFLDAKKAEYRSYWIQNMFMVTADIKLVQELANQSGVDHIELYHQPYVDRVGNDLGSAYGPEHGPILPAADNVYSGRKIAGYGREFGPAGINAVEWNITRVGAEDVWGLGITGAGAVIGDLDTGVQWDHPALINQYRPQIPGTGSVHDYNWYDGVVGSPTPVDYDTHGTHTMGTIVGDDGGANQIGMAPGADWIACPGIGSPYVGPFECFQFFLAPTKLDGSDPRPDLAPHVISNSWSSAGTNFHPAIQALYAAGIFYSKSAGNNGPSCSTITNPGQWPEVTATAAFANGDTIASFSSRGPVYIGLDPVMKPDIAAPGVAVRSSIPTDSYGSMSGTSMACPHVTGAVALLISANPELAGKIDVLQMLLKLNAEPKISAQCAPYVDHPNDVWGWGILDILSAVQMAQGLTFGLIEGTVVDESTLDPIPDAAITFEDTSTNWQLTGMSDVNGNYTNTLPSATYDLSAYKYGYLPGTVTGVVVTDGVTVTQNITLTTAPLWAVSGVVNEAQTGDPLVANLEFLDTPISTQSDPATGAYTADVAEGTWWLHVTSPGHTTENRQLTVDQDLTEDFNLAAIYNYYMQTSQMGACGPVFSWIDAAENGTPHPLSDDSSVYVAFPAGRSFTFYGNSYIGLYVGSNGIVTFGAGNSKWSGPIPDTATPNNGIYAFSTDLNPENGTQGNIYTDFIGDRYFVIEWFQVQHYPSGDPETFEIILDLDTGQASIQILTVSNPAEVVVGVENSTGTEATQYAYNDPVLIADGVAVDFYPAFGTPPPTGGPGELMGTITDDQTNAPINGASVTVEAYTTGEVFNYTANATGVYSDVLCADWYIVNAQANGYYPSADYTAVVLSDTETSQDISLIPYEGIVATPTELTATLEPDSLVTQVLTIENHAIWSLWYSLAVTPTVDWLNVTPITGTIDPAGSQLIDVTFDSTGLSDGVYDTILEVASNDMVQPLIQVPVELTVVTACELVHDIDFTWTPITPTMGTQVSFDASAMGTEPFTYEWTFSNGFTATGEMIDYVFAEMGTYTVTLTVSNCIGAEESVSYTITVEPPTVVPLKVVLPILVKQ